MTRNYKAKPRNNLKKLIHNQIQSELSPELKFASIPYTNSAVSSTGTVPGSLFGVAQGDGGESRDGNDIKVKSILLKGVITQNGSATNTQVRVLLMRDLQQVASTDPTWTNAFEAHSVVSMKNHNVAGRFQVLMDRTYAFGSKQNVLSFDFYKRVNMNVKFNGTAATNVQKGGLYLFCISNEATNTASLEWSSSIRYLDC